MKKQRAKNKSETREKRRNGPLGLKENESNLQQRKIKRTCTIKQAKRSKHLREYIETEIK